MPSGRQDRARRSRSTADRSRCSSPPWTTRARGAVPQPPDRCARQEVISSLHKAQTFTQPPRAGPEGHLDRLDAFRRPSARSCSCERDGRAACAPGVDVQVVHSSAGGVKAEAVVQSLRFPKDRDQGIAFDRWSAHVSRGLAGAARRSSRRSTCQPRVSEALSSPDGAAHYAWRVRCYHDGTQARDPQVGPGRWPEPRGHGSNRFKVGFQGDMARSSITEVRPKAEESGEKDISAGTAIFERSTRSYRACSAGCRGPTSRSDRSRRARRKRPRQALISAPTGGRGQVTSTSTRRSRRAAQLHDAGLGLHEKGGHHLQFSLAMEAPGRAFGLRLRAPTLRVGLWRRTSGRGRSLLRSVRASPPGVQRLVRPAGRRRGHSSPARTREQALPRDEHGGCSILNQRSTATSPGRARPRLQDRRVEDPQIQARNKSRGEVRPPR